MTAPQICVYEVEKACYECGKIWKGRSFVPHPEGATPLPGVCDDCIDKSEARLAAMTVRRPSGLDDSRDYLDLEPPKRVGR